MKLTILAALFLAIGVGAVGQQPRAIEVWPVDEAVIDPDLVATRTAVIAALRQHDLEPLMALMADDVYNHGYGRSSDTLEQRKAELRSWFTARWKLEPRTVERMVEALSMGGSFTMTRGSNDQERQFCAPYVYSAFPFPVIRDLLDYPGGGYDVGLLIAKDVPVRRRPGVRAPIVTRVSYRLVHIATVEGDRDPQGEMSWEHIITDDGVDGYVPKNIVRRPNDYYVCFGRREGSWRITDFGEDRYPGEP